MSNVKVTQHIKCRGHLMRGMLVGWLSFEKEM